MIGVSKHVMFEIGCWSRASNNLSFASAPGLRLAESLVWGELSQELLTSISRADTLLSISQLEMKVYDRLGREEDQGTEIPDGRWQV
jgi:hypothetical protein